MQLQRIENHLQLRYARIHRGGFWALTTLVFVWIGSLPLFQLTTDVKPRSVLEMIVMLTTEDDICVRRTTHG
jgi:hypothetical protein